MAPSSKIFLWLGGGAAVLIVALNSYSAVGLGSPDAIGDGTGILEPAQSLGPRPTSSQTADNPGSELDREDDERAALVVESEFGQEREGETGGLVRDYEREMALYLNSFAGDHPDLLGWTDYLSRLAIEAELDLESIYSDDDGTHGVLVLPGSDLSIEVSYQDKGYSLALEAQVQIDSVGPITFNAAMALPVKEGNLENLFGTVQFYPDSSQSTFKENPMGYLYEMEDGETSFRAMQGIFEDGRFSIVVESKQNSQQSELGDLTVPYTLMLRLQELSSFSND